MTLAIVGLASTWDLDLQGDVIERGAYKRTLEHWRRRGSGNPGVCLVDSHDYSSVRKIVGHMVEADETAEGLLTRFDFIPDDPDAKAAFQRYESGALMGLSIGYDVVRSRPPMEAERKAGIRRVLQELRLMEVSAVQFPANPGAIVTRTVSGGKTRYLLLERAQQKITETKIQQASDAIGRALSRRRMTA